MTSPSPVASAVGAGADGSEETAREIESVCGVMLAVESAAIATEHTDKESTTASDNVIGRRFIHSSSGQISDSMLSEKQHFTPVFSGQWVVFTSDGDRVENRGVTTFRRASALCLLRAIRGIIYNCRLLNTRLKG